MKKAIPDMNSKNKLVDEDLPVGESEESREVEPDEHQIE